MDNQGPIYFFHEDRDNGVFCQWYSSPFDILQPNGASIHYYHAEQYMMHQKALLGVAIPGTPQNKRHINEILLTKKPRKCKSLGRTIPDFDTKRWDECKFKVVVEGSYLKFTSTEELKRTLLETGERELVEASHFDTIWGVGFTPEQLKLGEKGPAPREKWGQNLLGKALMGARERIRDEEEAMQAIGEAGAVQDTASEE